VPGPVLFGSLLFAVLAKPSSASRGFFHQHMLAPNGLERETFFLLGLWFVLHRRDAGALGGLLLFVVPIRLLGLLFFWLGFQLIKDNLCPFHG